jgi:1,4-dihydroxy-2-naphthoyl-CoA hydrolase
MTFSYLRKIYLSDTDAAGVLYFARGMSLCHEAYEEWLQEQGLGVQLILQEKKIALPIVRAEIDFWQPIFCGDRVKIELKLLDLQESSFKIAYQIFSESFPDKLLVKALTKHVCINPETRERVPLPKAIGERGNRD